MNEVSVDLTNCDREPIHVPGNIQSFGYLIAVSSDWLISRVSANIANLMGKSPDDVLGLPLLDFLGAKHCTSCAIAQRCCAGMMRSSALLA
ncbi:hypothetical protein [Sphingomonas paeninsulae]|uniref:hypothetical protein n=1 Tax=Sphingomonas paeninsulae TaxID=2319844 RepID=UPI00267CE2AF